MPRWDIAQLADGPWTHEVQMATTKCYVVLEGWDYEGSAVVAVCMTEADARSHCAYARREAGGRWKPEHPTEEDIAFRRNLGQSHPIAQWAKGDHYFRIEVHTLWGASHVA